MLRLPYEGATYQVISIEAPHLTLYSRSSKPRLKLTLKKKTSLTRWNNPMVLSKRWKRNLRCNMNGIPGRSPAEALRPKKVINLSSQPLHPATRQRLQVGYTPNCNPYCITRQGFALRVVLGASSVWCRLSKHVVWFPSSHVMTHYHW